jgi:hypothetical protein
LNNFMCPIAVLLFICAVTACASAHINTHFPLVVREEY